MKISKKRYIQLFCIIVVALGITRAVNPRIAYDKGYVEPQDTISPDSTKVVIEKPVPVVEADSGFVPHRIYSVSSYDRCFPDSNSVQLIAARKYGVPPVTNQAEAERMKDKLVYVGSNPYFFVDKLKTSVPYLVPRASSLLQEIGEVFFDSLQIKGIPMHKIVVTSVLRSKEDVARLQRNNPNATTNSCHQYGTTFDIAYNRFKTVEAPEGPKRREVQNDSLKWVLSEVLNDMRKDERCYVKYEKKQGCYHITVR